MDDALDVSMVHGLTGIIGSIYIGFFASTNVNPAGADGLVYGGGARLLLYQLAAVALVSVWSAVVTFVVLLVCQYTIAGGIRVSDDEEEVGLDWAAHGEIAYHKLHVLVEAEKRQQKYAQFTLTNRELHNGEQEREQEEQHARQLQRDRRLAAGEGGLTLDGNITPDDGSEEKTQTNAPPSTAHHPTYTRLCSPARQLASHANQRCCG